MKTQFLKILFIIATLGCLQSGLSYASEYPNRPIKLIIPYSAGGDTGKVAQDLLPVLSKYLNGKAITIENIPGNNGQLGTRALLASPADGYTLMLGRIGNLILAPAIDEQVKPVWDSVRYVSMIDMQGIMCVVNQNSPITNLRDLVEQLKKSPTKLRYSTSGSGSLQNFFTVYFLRLIGLTYDAAQPLHTTGGGEALQALVNGKVDFLCSNIALLTQPVLDGKVRPLVVNVRKVVPALASVPNAYQVGMRDLVKLQGWTALVAPPTTPENVVAKLKLAMMKVADDPDWLKTSTGQASINVIKASQRPEDFVREQGAFYDNLAVLTRLLK